ncbi:hypothetical protein M9H77_02889 [Catharanthus roseus]|uniref:Uncharacterized protein n=1 Tax=Catharanthus roseus TaxID=4058 RepID=A0ACC0C9R0_CATRO|nr:hypothetical protein M9H77_02889 [Catharanthus roseus]
MNFDPVIVLNHFMAPSVAEPLTMGRANAQERNLDKRIRSCITFFVESSISKKKCLAEAKKRLTHFIRQANDLHFTGTTKTTISLFPFFGATFFFFQERCSRHCKPDGTQFGFGRYGTKSCRVGHLSYRAIEATRRAIIGHFHRAMSRHFHRTMSGQFRRNGKIWVRVFADFPITGKPTEVRTGRRKGNLTSCVARVSTGQILFEINGVSLSNA